MKKFVIFTSAVLIILAALLALKTYYKMNSGGKKVNVWDTYVTKKDGTIMHFDIIAPVEVEDTVQIYAYGKEYLKMKDQNGQPLTSKQCRLCHMEWLKPEWELEIEEKGYFIIEMEGCD